LEHPLRQLSLADLRTRTSVKWRRYPEDVLPLWVAEMDVPLAEPIVDAVTAALQRGDTGYSCGTAYAEALAGFAATRWGWHLDVDRARLVPDVMLGSVEVLRLVTAPGEGVVVNPPVYPPFYDFIEHADRRVVEVPLDDGHRLDLDGLAAAFARVDVTGYLLCSPHNPTGTVHAADELRAVADLADRHGVGAAEPLHVGVEVPAGRPVGTVEEPFGGRGARCRTACWVARSRSKSVARTFIVSTKIGPGTDVAPGRGGCGRRSRSSCRASRGHRPDPVMSVRTPVPRPAPRELDAERRPPRELTVRRSKTSTGKLDSIPPSTSHVSLVGDLVVQLDRPEEERDRHRGADGVDHLDLVGVEPVPLVLPGQPAEPPWERSEAMTTSRWSSPVASPGSLAAEVAERADAVVVEEVAEPVPEVVPRRRPRGGPAGSDLPGHPEPGQPAAVLEPPVVELLHDLSQVGRPGTRAATSAPTIAPAEVPATRWKR
jgi:hypothetical protein